MNRDHGAIDKSMRFDHRFSSPTYSSSSPQSFTTHLPNNSEDPNNHSSNNISNQFPADKSTSNANLGPIFSNHIDDDDNDKGYDNGNDNNKDYDHDDDDDSTMELQYHHHYNDANALTDGHHNNDQSNGSPSLLATDLNVQRLLHGGGPINSTSNNQYDANPDYSTIIPRINDNLITATTSYNQIVLGDHHYNPTNSNSMGASNDALLIAAASRLDAQTKTRLLAGSSSDYSLNIANTNMKYDNNNIDNNYMGSKYIQSNTELEGFSTPNDHHHNHHHHHHHHNGNEMHSLLQMLGYIKY